MGGSEDPSDNSPLWGEPIGHRPIGGGTHQVAAIPLPIERIGYLVEHTVEITDHIPAPDPYHRKADRTQIGVALLVVGPTMLGAIGFDDQEVFEADEVDDVFPNRMLAPEMDTEFPVSQRPPQQRLSVGRIVTHPSGEGSLPTRESTAGHACFIRQTRSEINPLLLSPIAPHQLALLADSSRGKSVQSPPPARFAC